MNYTDRIELRKLTTADGLEIPNKRAVVNINHNRVLGIVSPRYKIIHNTDLLNTVKPVLEELKLNNKQPQITQTRGGAVTFFRFLGDRVTSEIQKGDIVRFGVEFFNSYDGSMPVGFHIIAERLVCMNGLVVPKSITEISVRHIGGANSREVRNRLQDYFSRTTEAIDLWKKWVDIKPKDNQVEDFLKKAVGRRQGQEFLNKYKNLSDEKKNLWEFYNILTYYITHQIKSRKAESKVFRQFQMTEVLTNRLTRVFTK